MNTFFKKRSMKKQALRFLKEAAHARNLREDVATDQQLENLAESELKVKTLLKSDNFNELETACNELSRNTAAMYPRVKFPGLRENIEVLVVAVAVAMTFRSYFVQPFKIPTSSMYPTLNGIQFFPQDMPGFMDKFPQKLLKAAVFGEWYMEVRAKTSGHIQKATQDDKDFLLVNSVPHEVNRQMKFYVNPGEFVVKDQLLASAVRIAGDHIFVNRLIWNFRKPQRGEIMVFRTDGIEHPRMNQKLHYVKRMLGLPGEKIQINPPNILINGERLTKPEKILKIERAQPGYVGYKLAPGGLLAKPEDYVQLNDSQYFAVGDNQTSSFDSRYWGTVPEKNLLGPTFMVYWPFSRHWGLVD